MNSNEYRVFQFFQVSRCLTALREIRPKFPRDVHPRFCFHIARSDILEEPRKDRKSRSELERCFFREGERKDSREGKKGGQGRA